MLQLRNVYVFLSREKHFHLVFTNRALSTLKHISKPDFVFRLFGKNVGKFGFVGANALRGLRGIYIFSYMRWIHQSRCPRTSLLYISYIFQVVPVRGKNFTSFLYFRLVLCQLDGADNPARLRGSNRCRIISIAQCRWFQFQPHGRSSYAYRSFFDVVDAAIATQSERMFVAILLLFVTVCFELGIATTKLYWVINLWPSVTSNYTG